MGGVLEFKGEIYYCSKRGKKYKGLSFLVDFFYNVGYNG